MICETLLERYIQWNFEIDRDVFIECAEIQQSELKVTYYIIGESSKSITINIWEMLMFINRES